MAILGKMRSYSWMLLAFVGLALLAFILGDFFKKGTFGNSSNITEVGKIGKTTISRRDFFQMADDEYNKEKQKNKDEKQNPNLQYQVKQRVWDNIVRKTLMYKEYEELGLAIEEDSKIGPSISKLELSDLIRGKNLHPIILQYFSDPKTGQVNRANIDQIINNFDQMKPEQQDEWLSIEKAIREDRLNTKYNNLVSHGLYVTSAQAKRYAESRSNSVNFRYVAVNYSTVPDNIVKFSEDDIKKYYEDHKYEYEQEKSRDLEYVYFEIKPSAEDIKVVVDTINNIKTKFEALNDKDVKEFVNYNSDSRYDSTFHKKGTLTPALDSILFDAKVGSNFGPILDNNSYKLAKLIAVQERSDSAKSRHIFISWKGAKGVEQLKITRSKEAAKAKADSLASAVRKDTSKFKDLAIKFSDDPSAKEKFGEIGWFLDGTFPIKSYNDFCVKGDKGDVKVIEGEMGYFVVHLMDVTKPVSKAQVAIIEKALKPSKATEKSIYTKANSFSSKSTNALNFVKEIKSENLVPRAADFIRESDFTLAGLESPRELIRWAFDENSKKNDISQLFVFGDKIVVAKLKEAREKGFATIDQVRKEMEAGVRKEKKSAVIVENLKKQISPSMSIDDLGKKLSIQVDTATNVSLSAFGIPKLGAEPEVIGSIFGYKKTGLNKPISGKSAVVVAFVDGFNTAPLPSDLSQFKKMMRDYLSQRSSYEVYNAILKSTDIIDNRLKLY